MALIATTPVVWFWQYVTGVTTVGGVPPPGVGVKVTGTVTLQPASSVAVNV